MTQHKLQRRGVERQQKWRYVVAMTLSAVLMGLGVFATSLFSTPPKTAHALENLHGPGINWGNGIHIHGAGAFIVDGTYAYCAEIWVRSGTATPDFVGASSIPAASSDGVSVASTVGAPLREISFVLARYGQTTNNIQAAAVALAVWEIRGAQGRGNAAYEAELVRVRASVGSEVVALTQQFRAEAANWVASVQASPSSESTPGITLDPSSPYRGTVKVPLGTRSLRIQNGKFLDGSTSREWPASGAPIGTSLSWVGVPPSDSWGKFYRVSFTGDYLEVPTSILWSDGQGSQSSISLTEPKVKPLRETALDADTTWHPEVSSMVVSKYVSVGTPHSDDVVFSSASASNGLSGDWRWRISATGTREWMPVTASVTAYGPYLSDPALNPSFEAPVGAPIAARGSLTTEPTRDQSVPQRYSFKFDQPILEQGYYTYKWNIDGNEQLLKTNELSGCSKSNENALCSALPKNYFFSDGFGTAGETQIGKSVPAFSTEISTTTTELNGTLTDRIDVPKMQNWLRDSTGSRIPLTLTGTAYLVPGPELAQSVDVPDSAVALTTVQVTTNPELNEQSLYSPAISIPISTPREFEYVSLRWCVIDEDQLPEARGMWEEVCDDLGLASESARIIHPEVRSVASNEAAPGTAIADKAIVNGSVPANAALVFELFKKPELAGLQPLLASERAADSLSRSEFARAQSQPVCTLENRVFVSTTIPVQPGLVQNASYHSEEVSVGDPGTYWWVESLIHRDPDTGEETILHLGECGLPNETTSVAFEVPGPPPALAKTGSAAPLPSTFWATGMVACGLLICGVVRMTHARKEARASTKKQEHTDGEEDTGRHLGSKLTQSKRLRFFPAHHLAKM